MIRTRRTHKAYGADSLSPEVVAELLELARWAPNHHLTEPWRFRVLGPQTLELLIAAAEQSEGLKLRRAPTLVVASATQTGDEHQNGEDLLATACAVYVVLLAAHARGLASYWRTPRLLETAAGRAAIGLPDDERFVALIHLGQPVTSPPVKERRPTADYVAFLP